MDRFRSNVAQVQQALQWVATGLLAGLACMATLATVLALFGLWPWLRLSAGFGTMPAPEAGPVLQIGLTLVLLAICSFLPASWRVLRLEQSHRQFQLSMRDVAEAYRIAHREDRAGAFALSGEFDAMRERLAHLRRHPDLAGLEPELLELSAQMSLQSRHLAQVYSDENVARAKAHLAARQAEVTAFRERMTMASYACAELKRWLQDVEADEKVAQAQLERLERDLREVLPNLGYDFEDAANVVQMPVKPGK